jgi:hypothetical protein
MVVLLDAVSYTAQRTERMVAHPLLATLVRPGRFPCIAVPLP